MDYNFFHTSLQFFTLIIQIPTWNLSLMITWTALCPAGSTLNKTPKFQVPINQISGPNQPNFIIFFCATSTGINESNRMQYGSCHRTNISKLNFVSGRTGRTAGPTSSTLVKLSLSDTNFYHPSKWTGFLTNFPDLLILNGSRILKYKNCF